MRFFLFRINTGLENKHLRVICPWCGLSHLATGARPGHLSSQGGWNETIKVQHAFLQQDSSSWRYIVFFMWNQRTHGALLLNIITIQLSTLVPVYRFIHPQLILNFSSLVADKTQPTPPNAPPMTPGEVSSSKIMTRPADHIHVSFFFLCLSRARWHHSSSRTAPPGLSDGYRGSWVKSLPFVIPPVKSTCPSAQSSPALPPPQGRFVLLTMLRLFIQVS